MSNVINLEKNILENAKISACRIADKDARIRAYALNIAANATAYYLDSLGLESDTSLSLYKIAKFEEQFEIADVYVKGFRFDVRVSFDGKTFTVPKIHAKYGATPLAYIVIKLDESLLSAEFLGFLPTDELNYPESNLEYYTFDTTVLKPIDEIKELIENSTLNIHPYSANNHEKIKELSISFIDDEISESEKVFFIKHVLACPVCRESFCDVNDFDTIVAQIKNYQELLNDSTLSVLSGNKKEFDEAVIANLGYVENAEENNIIEQPDVDVNLPIPEPDLQDDSIVATENLVEELPIADENGDDSVSISNVTSDELLLAEDVNEDVIANIDDIEPENVANDDSILIPELNSIEENVLAEEPWEEENGLNSETMTLSVEEPIFAEPSMSDSDLDEDDTLTEAEKDFDLLDYADDNDFVEDAPVEKTEEVLDNHVDNSEIVVNAEENNDNLILDEVHTLEELDEIESLHNESVNFEHLELHEDMHILEEQDENNSLSVESDEKEEILLQEKPLELNDGFDNLEEVEFENVVEDSSLNAEENAVLELPSGDIDNLANDINVVDENPDNTELIVDEPESKPYVPFEPVELNYDEEYNDTEDSDDVSETMILEDEEQSEQQEITPEESVNSVDEEIQSLLDDDLRALLSEDSEEEEPSEPAVVQSVDETTVLDDSLSQSIEQTEPVEDIQTLFENDVESESKVESVPFELAQEPISQEVMKKTKNFAILAGLLIVLLGAGSSMLVLNKQKSMQTGDSISGKEMFDFSSKAEDDADNMPAVSQDINRSIANSFSDKPSAITITKLSWQVSEKLAVEPSVKEYLQTAGKNIQMNLQNDIANSADVIMNNIVKVSFVIAPDNTLKGLQILESSGSDSIDETISTSIKNTLKYVRVPNLKDFKSDYFLTLIINF